MTAEMNQATGKSSFLPEFPTGNADDLLRHATRFQMKMLKTGLDMQKDYYAFLQHRYQQDAKLASALMNTREPTDVMSQCVEFFQDALDDYSREAVKITNFGAIFAVEAADQATVEVEEAAKKMEQIQQASEANELDVAEQPDSGSGEIATETPADKDQSSALAS
jgi:hypothetical protein